MEGSGGGPKDTAKSGRRSRGAGISNLIPGRVGDDLGALTGALRGLPEILGYLRQLAATMEKVAEDTTKMREATERLDLQVVALNEKFEGVEHGVHDLAQALRPIRSRRRARERAAKEYGEAEAVEDDVANRSVDAE